MNSSKNIYTIKSKKNPISHSKISHETLCKTDFWWIQFVILEIKNNKNMCLSWFIIIDNIMFWNYIRGHLGERAESDHYPAAVEGLVWLLKVQITPFVCSQQPLIKVRVLNVSSLGYQIIRETWKVTNLFQAALVCVIKCIKHAESEGKWPVWDQQWAVWMEADAHMWRVVESRIKQHGVTCWCCEKKGLSSTRLTRQRQTNKVYFLPFLF